MPKAVLRSKALSCGQKAKPIIQHQIHGRSRNLIGHIINSVPCKNSTKISRDITYSVCMDLAEFFFFLKSWSLAQASTRKAAVSSFKSPGCWVLVLHAAVRPKFAGELARMLLSEAVSSAQTSGGGERAVFARFSQRQFFVVVVSPPPHCGLSCLK